ncbi:MAG: hypothetical protein K2G02_04840, partial [Phocaeicola sp.]|nr:hypothetical protein [Phocaeicola sp.]
MMKHIYGFSPISLILPFLHACNNDVFVDKIKLPLTKASLNGDGGTQNIRFNTSNWQMQQMKTIHKLLAVLLLASRTASGLWAQNLATTTEADTLLHPMHRPIHKISADVRPAYLLPTSSFFKGNNASQQRMNIFLSGHLKYGILFDPESEICKRYPHTTQGIGIAVNTLFNNTEIGTPLALYVFQNSRIATLTP